VTTFIGFDPRKFGALPTCTCDPEAFVWIQHGTPSDWPTYTAACRHCHAPYKVTVHHPNKLGVISSLPATPARWQRIRCTHPSPARRVHSKPGPRPRVDGWSESDRAFAAFDPLTHVVDLYETCDRCGATDLFDGAGWRDPIF